MKYEGRGHRQQPHEEIGRVKLRKVLEKSVQVRAASISWRESERCGRVHISRKVNGRKRLKENAEI